MFEVVLNTPLKALRLENAKCYKKIANKTNKNKYNRKLNKKFGSQNRKQVGLVLVILMKVYDREWSWNHTVELKMILKISGFFFDVIIFHPCHFLS